MSASGAWLRFARTGRDFAVPAEHARAVVVQPQVAPVPRTPPVLVGLIAWRGNVVPLLEPDPAPTRVTPEVRAAVLLASERGEIALAADAVHGWDDAPGDDDRVLDPDHSWTLARKALHPAGDRVGGTHLDR